MCALFIGEFFQCRGLIRFDSHRIELHGFTATLIFVRARGSRGNQWNGLPIDDGVEAIRKTNSFIEGLGILEFKFHPRLGLQTTKELIEEVRGLHRG